jgi:hypothetical protein
MPEDLYNDPEAYAKAVVQRQVMTIHLEQILRDIGAENRTVRSYDLLRALWLLGYRPTEEMIQFESEKRRPHRDAAVEWLNQHLSPPPGTFNLSAPEGL